MLENRYEKEYWSMDRYVMGIDEAGRGPLCGPLVVACCVLPINYVNDEINDSKQLSEKMREKLFRQIIKDAHHYEFRIVSPKQIDELDIYHATQNLRWIWPSVARSPIPARSGPTVRGTFRTRQCLIFIGCPSKRNWNSIGRESCPTRIFSANSMR